MNEHDDSYVDAMLMVNMQDNTRSVTVPVRASGGGRRPRARRLLVRSSLFPYSTVVGARALIDSLDALSVLEAAVLDDCMRD